MTDPGDVTANYVQLMDERGWDWLDLAEHFRSMAEQPSLDRGASARGLERWARSRAEAAAERSSALEREQRTPIDPVDPAPEPPRRTATTGTPGRRG